MEVESAPAVLGVVRRVAGLGDWDVHCYPGFGADFFDCEVHLFAAVVYDGEELRHEVVSLGGVFFGSFDGVV